VKLYDYKEAREQMKLLNGKVDLSTWGTKENFLQAVQWLAQNDTVLDTQAQQFRAQRR
jgi:hypothetical protein